MLDAGNPTALGIMVRGYSVIWSLIGIFLLIELAGAMAGPGTARLAGLFAAVNPLDIYFADEARMYSQVAAIFLAGSLALWHWSESVRRGAALAEWWKAAASFAICGSALLLTHYSGVTLLVGQGLLALAIFVRVRAWSSVMGLALATVAVAVCFSPWLIYVLHLRGTLVHEAGLKWRPYPGLVDYVSFVGREFFWGLSFKVHDQWWIPTALLPVCIFGVAISRGIRNRSREGSEAAIHLLGHVALPLLVSAIVCASYQIVYYRPRYAIFLLPYFLIGLAMACRSLGSKRLTVLAGIAVAGLMGFGTVVQERTPQKHAWRETAESWPALDAPAFYVVLPAQHQRPLRHYLGDRIRHTPRHVLERLLPLPEGAVVWVANWPEPMTQSDAAYRDWLKTVGPARNQTLSSYYTLTQVEPKGGEVWPGFAERRFRAWYRPFDVRGEVAGFSEAQHFGPITFDAEGQPMRKSEHGGWLRFDGVPGGEALVIRATPERAGSIPRLQAIRAHDPSELSSPGPSIPFDRVAQEYRWTTPPGDDPIWVGWQVPEEPDSGLLLHWVGMGPQGASGMASLD
jgi:4-amino-4-deoxy-L-arabinose transferase-like glycosyltransferase